MGEDEKLVPSHMVLIGPPKDMESNAGILSLKTEDLDEATQSKLKNIQQEYEVFMATSRPSWASVVVTSSMPPW